MALLLELLISVLSIYLVAKGVERVILSTKNYDPNRVNNVLLGLIMIVVGLSAGLGTIYWMVRNP